MLKLVLLLVVSAWASLTPTKDHLEDQAERCSFQAPAEYQHREFNYRLLRPQTPGVGLQPLIVWYHGYGDYEFDLINEGQLKYIDELFPDLASLQNSSFYLLAVHLPRDVRSWTRSIGTETHQDGLAVVDQLIEDLLTRESIDPERITAVGISGGGTACWSLVSRYPERFAAVVPLASSGISGREFSSGQAFPNAIWAFHGAGDHPESVSATTSLVRELGANARLTLIPGGAHNCWTRAMQDYQLLPWLLSQRRHRLLWFQPPGRVPWKPHLFWAQLCLPLLISAGIATEAVFGRRRPRGSSSRKVEKE